MKKFIAFIFAALFAAGVFADTETVDGVTYTYTISDGEATIGAGYMSAAIPTSTTGSLAIPSTLGGRPVTTIGDYAFEYCSSLKSVTIPDSVTTIGDYAFCGCSALNGIDVSDENLTYRSIDGALYSKDGRTLICWPSAKMPASIPDGVTTIGRAAFWECGALESIVIPSGVTEIQDEAFVNCYHLRTISFPASIKRIGESVFVGCFSEETEEVWNWETDGCEYVTIRYQIEEVRVESVDEWCRIEFDGFNPMSDGAILYENGAQVRDVVVPDDVKNLAFTFQGCKSLESVILPNGLAEIGLWAFSGCTNLTKINIPSSVTTIRASAFSGCDSLTGITIPKSVTEIERYAFSGSLKTVTVDVDDMQRVKNMLDGGGVNVEALTFIETDLSKLPDGGPYTETVDGVEYTFYVSNGEAKIGTGSGDAAIPTITSGAIVIPLTLGGYSVTAIGYRAFLGCSSLKSVTIPNSVTTLESSAFRGCSSLTSMIIPDGLTTIGSSAFYGCSSLESVTIPASVTEIGSEAFANCSALNEVTILAKDPHFGSAAFGGTPWYESKIMGLVLNGGASGAANSVAVTNVVVHYVMNSVQPTFAKPVSEDTGFVNVIAEVKGNNVAVPQTWAENYPDFAAKFGSDFTKALTAKSGKIAAGGREMLVWEDYVAGTDPTDPDSKFTASVTIVDGKVVVSYTPELDPDRAALRKYTTYGKVKLTDADWTEVPEGHEADYNFFKVTVEMK